jgi:ESCRT-I complex subunit VPS28
MVAIDQIHPLLSDLVEAVQKCSFEAFTGNVKLEAWLLKVSSMPANAELDAESVRQLLFDLENSYANFHKALK